jgi:hypothetical protein
VAVGDGPVPQGPDLPAGQWRLIAELGAAPKALGWDNRQWNAHRAGRPARMSLARGPLPAATVIAIPAAYVSGRPMAAGFPVTS